MSYVPKQKPTPKPKGAGQGIVPETPSQKAYRQYYEREAAENKAVRESMQKPFKKIIKSFRSLIDHSNARTKQVKEGK